MAVSAAEAMRARRRKSGPSPATQASVLADAASMAGGTLATIGHVLDTPGAMVRGTLDGGIGKGLSALYESSDDRVTGRELLRSYGLASDKDDWVSWSQGLAAEILLDPLAMLSGPAKALTPAGQAVKAAGLSDEVARAASRAYLDNAAKVSPEIASRAKSAYDALTKDGRNLTANDLFSKPLVGKRAAAKFSTLDDVVKYADDPKAARDDVVSFLGKGDAKAGEDAFNKIKSQNLSNDIGVGLPFQDAAVTYDLGKFGNTYRDVLDAVSSSVRWSPAGRLSAKLFDKRVDGAYAAEDQMLQAAAYARKSGAESAATRDSAEQISLLNSRSPASFTEDGGKMIGRLVEGNATADDLSEWAKNPAMREIIEWFDDASEEALQSGREMGLGSAKIEDPNGLMYLPYQADSMFEMASRDNKKLQRSLSFLTGDQLKRGKTLRLPGGRDQIMRLSQDPMVTGPKRTLTNDAAAADYLAQQVYGATLAKLPPKRRTQVNKLARLLHRLPNEATDIAPLFGQHPVQMMQKYVVGRAGATATLDSVLDGMVTFARNEPANVAAGGGRVSIAQALKNIGGRTVKENGLEIGARQQMRQRLAKAFGLPEDKVDLKKWSVGVDDVRRLNRAREGFEDGAASSQLVKWLDSYTSVWKGSILTWPSRIVRDLYSGAYGNWLAGAFTPRAAYAAKTLLEYGADSPQFQELLQALPRYAGIADPVERAAAFNADLAATNLLSTGAHLDRTATVSGKDVLQQIPGAEPLTARGAIGALADIEGYKPKNFFSIRTPASPYAQTRNPILIAGEKANNLSDGINRLTGYYALLEQGYSPAAAAREIQRVQVDYGSLTQFERGWMKRVFPWYTYQSRIFGEVVDQLATRPGGRYGQTIRLLTRGQQDASEDAYIPEYLRESVAIPIGSSGDSTTYLHDIDILGLDQLNMIQTPGVGKDVVLGTAREVAQQLSPQYRIATELLTQRDLYHDRPIAQSQRGFASNAYRTLTGEELPYGYLADRIIGNVPFVQRPATALSQLLDDRTGRSFLERAGTTAIGQVSGVKTRAVDGDAIRYDISNLMQNSVDALPQARTMQRVFVPEDLEPTLPQWARDRLEYIKYLDQQRREAQAAA
jgi:hypothetical protein